MLASDESRVEILTPLGGDPEEHAAFGEPHSSTDLEVEFQVAGTQLAGLGKGNLRAAQNWRKST